MEQCKTENIQGHDSISKKYQISAKTTYSLTTSGAGFIGTNLNNRLLSEDKTVKIFDNLSRDGVEENLQWLRKKHGKKLSIQITDILETQILEECMKHVEAVLHFSAQMAVTTSTTNLIHDFEGNLKDTFNLLEVIRKTSHNPPLFFTSTHKIYGNLTHIEMQSDESRYYPKDT